MTHYRTRLQRQMSEALDRDVMQEVLSMWRECEPWSVVAATLTEQTGYAVKPETVRRWTYVYWRTRRDART